MELFRPLVPRGELHPNFVNTLRAPSASVRNVLMEWARDFPDRDGKFVKEFQTTYNSSFWELYHRNTRRNRSSSRFVVSSGDGGLG
jgi:hypothetical protein